MNGPYSDYSPLAKMNLNIMEPLAEVGDGFEPQTRARSNTWPLPRPDFADPAEEGGQGAGAASATANSAAGNKCPVPVPVSALPTKKNSSRRNAWGNLSYADLITQAITTSPDKRLTLSQIYEWMVQNVPYFKDKGDSNSSAGWKVRSKDWRVVTEKDCLIHSLQGFTVSSLLNQQVTNNVQENITKLVVVVNVNTN
ncbi:hypothetical protein GWI33_010616 [Rhynchophorus ferrugineus]|uniref:Fork-head domain-containing protein n=1 Tax=Rhynchophorus ferrugineus TaxID=354439 RepID=A0A834IX17_RHYFE|nr:hypothetical protein GWI33_010616 [Rhynchophorus ferrugineus]